MRSATAAERPAAAARLFGVGNRADRFLALFESGALAPDELLVADGLRGAIVAQALAGRLAVVTPPAADDPATADELLSAALGRLASVGSRVVQAYLDPGDDAVALERGGFASVTEVEEWGLALPHPLPRVGFPGGFLRFTSPPDPAVFGATLLATYDGSLDAPEAHVEATAEEVLAGYASTCARWLASGDAGPCGVLMLSTATANVEIEYLGVVPAARGRGVGAALVNHAVDEAVRAGCSRLAASVDARNHPAKRLYARFGFTLARTQRLYLRRLP